MFKISNQSLFLMVFLSCAALLATAYYFEYALYMDPCPLCIMQRIAVLMVGLVGLSGFILAKKEVGQRVHAGLMVVSAIFGLSVAGRHVWIQSLPADQIPTCGPSLDYMVGTLPWAEVLSVMLRGNGNCADAQWSLLGMSMPMWVLMCFAGFMLLAAFVTWQTVEKQNK
jgi:disulfide bond formation protein DsbB